jgi:hypothetical protein
MNAFAIIFCRRQYMLSTNNNDYDYIERKKKVIELYDQGKSTRDSFIKISS